MHTVMKTHLPRVMIVLSMTTISKFFLQWFTFEIFLPIHVVDDMQSTELFTAGGKAGLIALCTYTVVS